MNITIEFCIFELVWVPNFILNSFEFWDQVYPKRVFLVEYEKTEHHHWIRDMVKHELRVTSCELQDTSWKLKSTSWNSKVRVQIHELWVQIYQLRVQIHESRVQIHELRIQINELGVQIQISLSQWKTQVNSLNSSSLLKIISPKLWGNSYVQLLMIVSCFTFPPLHGHGFSKKLSK